MDKLELTMTKNGATDQMPSASSRYVKPISGSDRMTNDVADRDGFFPGEFLRPSRPEPIGLFGTDAEPRVNVVENGDKIVVTAEAPGFGKDKNSLACMNRIQYLFDVTVNDDTLTIEGKAECKGHDDSGDDLCGDIHSVDFTRTLTLPAMVNCGEASARYMNGVFEVSLPKAGKTARRDAPF